MGLSREQLARIDLLLDEALALAPQERARWLEDLPAEYVDLKEALGGALEGAGNVNLTLPKLNAPRPEQKPSDILGAYELIRELGHGGMARVWLARRADGSIKREVAVKIPTDLQLRGDLAERFEREKQILSTLEHPHIARLYDAGVSQSGLPYLALEYVDGRPITAWCDLLKMSIRARVELFLQALDAVAYAHKKGVLHRDIKPSNVLVSEEGQVRLLDFGVAKLFKHEDHLTRAYGHALTPDYASPEQFGDEELTAASDVYSLGVMLYELVCGGRPIPAQKHAGRMQTERVHALVPPSTRIDEQSAAARSGGSRSVARELRGDLDSVVMKALASEVGKRYAGVREFEQDLRRYLAGKPVGAGPHDVGHRAQRYLGRHALAATAVVLVAFVVGAIWTVRERSGAGGPAGGTLPALGPIQEKSIAVLAFADMSEKKDQEFFSDGLAEQLLDQLTSIPELKVIARTSSFYFKGKDVPLEEIGRQLRVANILQGSVRRSGNHLRVTTQLVRADSGVHLWSQTYDRQMKDIFQVQDDIAAAVVGALKVKLAAGQTITTVGTRNPEAYTQFILARQTQARAFDAESYGKAVEAFKKAIALDPKYADAFAGMAHAKAFTADALGDTGKGIDEALADAENAVALGPDRPYPYWIRAYIREGWRWDWAGATDDIEKAVALDAGDAGAWATRATMLEDQGRLTEALADNRRAIELSPLGGRLWSDYAMALVATGQYATAHEAFARALQIQPTLGNEAPSLIFVLIQLHESKFGDALATARKIGTEEIRLPSIAMVECSLHHAEESRRALQEAEAKFAKAQAYQIAEAHAWCEDANQGFKWLDRAYRQRDGGLSAIKWDPAFNSLRGDPRYAALLRKMNFPEGNATH